MSEAPEVTSEATTTDAPPAGSEVTEETVEQKLARMEKDLADTRREAAKYRVEARDGKSAKDELQKVKDAQLTEAERIQKRLTEAETAAAVAANELLRERIARRHGLEDDDMDLLGAGDEAQIEARAKRIAALKVAAAPKVSALPSDKPVAQLRPGATGAEKDVAPDDFPAHWRTRRTAQQT